MLPLICIVNLYIFLRVMFAPGWWDWDDGAGETRRADYLRNLLDEEEEEEDE